MQWKWNKLELSSLFCDHEYFSIWFSSLLDQNRSFMWDGDSNKVVALKKCFRANVVIFLTARKTLRRNVTRAQLQSIGENVQGRAQ